MRFLITTLLALISVSANSTTYVKQSVSTYFDNAEIVARIFVQKAELLESKYEGEKIGCAVKIRGKVIESFKGEVEVVDFYIEGMVLNLAEEYLVFLEGVNSKDLTPIASTNSMMQSESYKRSKACSQFYVGYKANWLNVSRFLKRWSKKYNEYEDWITPGYNVDLSEEDNVVRESVELRSLVVNGEVIEKEYWSVDDEVVFPDEFWMYEGAYQWEGYRAILQSGGNRERDNKARHEGPR